MTEYIKVGEEKYYYFVSYVATDEATGKRVYGAIQITTNVLATHYDYVDEWRDIIKQAPVECESGITGVKLRDIVILNFILLRKETE